MQSHPGRVLGLEHAGNQIYFRHQVVVMAWALTCDGFLFKGQSLYDIAPSCLLAVRLVTQLFTVEFCLDPLLA